MVKNIIVQETFCNFRLLRFRTKVWRDFQFWREPNVECALNVNLKSIWANFHSDTQQKIQLVTSLNTQRAVDFIFRIKINTGNDRAYNTRVLQNFWLAILFLFTSPQFFWFWKLDSGFLLK